MHKILVVEDEHTLRDVYKLILSTGPYMVDTAFNGKDALEKINDTTYDLILLDLMMPIVDGVGFLEECTTSGKLHSKVIILSNLSAGAELSRALCLGAYKNVLKSDLSPRQLLDTVHRELEAR